MIEEYLKAAMNTAHYEIIADEDPYYGEIAQLKGVWASGKTLWKNAATICRAIWKAGY